MSPELARGITILSVLVTVGAIGLATYGALRPARVRPRRDLVMLAISVATILALALIMRIRTPAGYAIAAAITGVVLGAFQGTRIKLEDREGTFFAQKDLFGLAAWGIGLAAIQVAGLGSRTGIIELGQTVSIGGMAMTATTLASRQRELVVAREKARERTAAVAAALPVPILIGLSLFNQDAEEPPLPPLHYEGVVEWDGILSIDGITLEFDPFPPLTVDTVPGETGSTATANGSLVVEFPTGEFNLSLVEGFATLFDDEISEEDEEDIAAARAERNCTTDLLFNYNSGPVPVTGGGASIPVTLAFGQLLRTDCSFDQADNYEDDSEPALWEPGTVTVAVSGVGTPELSGNLSGSWLGSGPFDFPVSLSTDGVAPPPGPASSNGTDDEFSEDDFDDLEDFDEEGFDDEDSDDFSESDFDDDDLFGDDHDDSSDGCDCGDEDEVSDNEAAGAGVVGAAGAAGVAAASAASAVGGAGGAAGGPGGGNGNGPRRGGNGRKPDGEDSGGGVATADDPAERLLDNARQAAAGQGWDDLVDRIDENGRNPDGTPNEDYLDRIRDVIRSRREREAIPDDDGTFLGDFASGVQEDIAEAADKVAEVGDAIHQPVISSAGRAGGWVVRNPGAAARIGVAVANPAAGAVIAAADVANELHDKATTPGDESLQGAAEEVGWVAGREAVMEVGGRVFGEALGAAARGMGDGVSEGVEAAARQGDEAAEAAARSTREGLEEGAEAGARSATDAAEEGAEAGARGATDAAEEGAEAGARGATDAAEEGAEAGTRGATDAAEEGAEAGARSATDAAEEGAEAGARGATDAAEEGAEAGARGATDAAEEGAEAGARSATDAAEEGAEAGARGATDAAEEGAEAGARGATDAAEEGAEAGARGATDAAEEGAEAGARGATDAAEEGAEAGARSADEGLDGAARGGDDISGGVKGTNEVPVQRTPANEMPDRVDDSWLKEADHGTDIPRDRIPETGYSPDQADALRKVADEEGVIIGSRTTNVDSLRHPNANPKPLDVKGKTMNDLDVQLGAREGDQGLAGMFKPKHPGPDASPELMARYNQRLAEFEKLHKKLPELNQKGINWDAESGLFVDKNGVPYKGDIDLVYIKDANTGELITGARYDEIVDKLQRSGAQVQHGAEQAVVNDIVRHAGEGARSGAEGLQQSLSAGHRPAVPDGGSWANPAGATQDLPAGASWADEAGSSWANPAGARPALPGVQEQVIETSADGWVKGAQPHTIPERVSGPNPLLDGLPSVQSDGSVLRP